jgi:hypothetical protein
VRLVAAVVFGAETPVYLWKNWLILEADRAEDAAAYKLFPSSEVDT